MDMAKTLGSPRRLYTKDKSKKKSAKLPGFSQQTESCDMRLYDKVASNSQLIVNLTPTQVYKALGVVREGYDPTPVEPVDLESLPQGEFRTLVVDPTVCVYRCILVWG